MSNSIDMIIRNEASNLELVEILEAEFKYLKNQYGVDIKYEIGDAPVDFVLFTDEKPIYIERKTISDFAASLRDKRLWQQAEAMTNEASRGIFLIEGSLFSIDKYHPDFKNSIIGAQRKLIKRGHELFYGFERDWTAVYIRLELEELKNITHKRRITLRATAAQSLNPAEQAQYIMEGFPGIGGAKSEVIRKNTNSLWNFLETVNYKTDTIKFLPPNLTKKIKDICMENWKA